MTTALRVAAYLRNAQVDYETVGHPAAPTSSAIAESAHIPGDQLVKAVVLKDEKGHLLAVLPSTHHIDFGAIKSVFHRSFDVAGENELKSYFPDCDLGAVPPIGAAYTLDTIADKSLQDEEVLYFEAGDQNQLIKVDKATFVTLMAAAEWAYFSQHDGPHQPRSRDDER
ncbi:MAG: YbaK/EbsC family protein [Alphaproteobacteria bacterium]|nr:YbaK/EbsC family protein [Alphaproteobacteria bacterium]